MTDLWELEMDVSRVVKRSADECETRKTRDDFIYVIV